MRGYGGTDQPEAIDQYTQLHHVGDMVGLLDALGADTAVIVGHDWGAPVAWNAALLRPDRFRAVAGLSVPYTPRGGTRPTVALARAYGETFMYMLYFQTPGVAEAELGRDVRSTVRRVLYGISGDGGGMPVLPKRSTFLEACPTPRRCPRGSAKPTSTSMRGVRPHGLSRRSQLVSQPRPHLGADGGLARRPHHRARALRRRRPRPRHPAQPRRHGWPGGNRARAARASAAPRRRPLDPAGAPGRGQRRADHLPGRPPRE